MKIVFAGPTLPDAADHAGDVVVRGPAALGDVARAVLQGATVIGIVDGYFENVASVWHKEILYALSEGVTVIGAASMGALRAAECAPFGMIGVGAVFAAYAGGALIDDDAVGQVHGPEELGYIPLSEPLVNIIATIHDLRAAGAIAETEYAAIAAMARASFFKERTWDTILAAAALDPRATQGNPGSCRHAAARPEARRCLGADRRGRGCARRARRAAARLDFRRDPDVSRLLEGWRHALAAAAA